MKASLVMATWNRADLIVQSLASVVLQTYRDYELIIVDDGSTDGTHATVEKFLSSYPTLRWKYLRNRTRQGQAGATNRGITEATGKYILTVDSDDLLLPHYLERAVPLLDSGSADIVAVNVMLFGENMERVIWDMSSVPWSLEQLAESNAMVSTSMYRRSLWEKVGGYDPSFPFLDWQFWVKCYLAGATLARIPEVLFWYRQKHEQETKHIDYGAGREKVRKYIEENKP